MSLSDLASPPGPVSISEPVSISDVVSLSDLRINPSCQSLFNGSLSDSRTQHARNVTIRGLSDSKTIGVDLHITCEFLYDGVETYTLSLSCNTLMHDLSNFVTTNGTKPWWSPEAGVFLNKNNGDSHA
ncbi:hypothetical protein ScPMuIL_018783 [Solemya velum]